MSYPNMELTDVGVVVLDCEHKTPPAQMHGYPYIAIPNLRDGHIHLSESRRISSDDLIAWTRRSKPQGGDVVVTRRGRVGDTAGIPPGIDCAIGQNLVLLRSVGDGIDQSFLRWAVRSPQWWSEVDRLMNVGAVFSSLNVRDVARIKIPVPPLREQLAIAEVLDALDDKIVANTKVAETSSQLAGLIYDQFVAEVPAIRMSEKLLPVLGGTPARSRTDYWGGDCLWASAKDVTGAPFGVIADTVEKISAAAVSGTKAKPLPSGSVILTARGTVGAVARLSRASSFNQSCYGFAPGGLPAGILFHAVLRATQRAKAIAHGSVFDTITMKTLDHLTIPDLDDETSYQLEAHIEPLLRTVDGVVQQNQTLAATRDALLPHLMSGKFPVEDAEKLVKETV